MFLHSFLKGDKIVEIFGLYFFLFLGLKILADDVR